MPRLRPVRLADWALGGACAGLLLGGAELLVEGPAGWRYPPPLALLVLSSSAVLGAASGALVGLALHAFGLRLTRPRLLGALLGILLALAVPPAWVGFTAAGALRLLAGLAAAGLVAAAAARLARAGEGSGRPASAGITLAGGALLFAGAARLVAPGLPAPDWPAIASVAAGPVVAAVGLSGARFSRSPGLSLPRLLAILVATGLSGVFFPWLLPSLLLDENPPALSPWPPNLVFVSLAASQGLGEADREEVIPAIELLAVDGITYHVSSEPVLASLLRLPDGSSLPSALRDTGYATAAIVTDPTRSPQAVTEYRDARPGGLPGLEQSARWMLAARLLLGPAFPLVSLVGQGRELRSPQQIADEASRWLVWWRTQLAPTPFFLVMDLRAPGADASSLDDALAGLLDTLWELELEGTTLVIAAVEKSGMEDSIRGGQAILAPPRSWPPIPQQADTPPTMGFRLSLSLLEIARSDGRSRLFLPGFTEGIVPPVPASPW